MHTYKENCRVTVNDMVLKHRSNVRMLLNSQLKASKAQQ